MGGSMSFLSADPEITRQAGKFNEAKKAMMKGSASQSSLLLSRKEVSEGGAPSLLAPHFSLG